MAKKQTAYVAELKRSIRERTGEPCPLWLMPLVRSTAMNMVMLESLQEEIMMGDLTSIEVGSQGQQKTIPNPLLVAYKECQRTLSLQFEKLGITYSATPSKIVESTKRGMEDDDPMKIAYDRMTTL